ncbi:hypothetical protein BCV70DRAFT_102807 [Testicularia cyperi]|uniref:Uncharacterized protein n=1 Tax=Testicularia cyperi TaxID=1882483 RepID=A0A317XPA2_9BASI|nr:hypothetical protein BCV70DRAFT_102807 [Testicularia cyperi]
MSANQSPAPNHGGGVAADPSSSSPSPSHSKVLLGRNAGKMDPEVHPPLPIEQVGNANRSAQIRGIFLGIGGGIMSAFIARRAMNLSKNAAYLSGLVAGTGVAYITAAQQLEHNLSAVESAEKGLRDSLRAPKSATTTSTTTTTTTSSSPSHSDGTDQEMLKYDLLAASNPSHEAGVSGLHTLHDKFATSRGDH